MQKYNLFLILLGSALCTFSTQAMLFSRIKSIKEQLFTKKSLQAIQTSKEYARDYSDWQINEWNAEKGLIKLALKKAHNNSEAIQNIVDYPYPSGRYVGQTPLCRAATMNDFEFTNFLLQNGANINADVRGIYGNDPQTTVTQALYFANTYEMVHHFHSNGADIKNHVPLISANILHTVATGYVTHDDRIFDYALAQGIDPNECDPLSNNNLWHSLMCSRYRRSEQSLLNFAAKLHALAINPYHKNVSGESAIDIIEESIKSNIGSINTPHPFKLKGENAKKAEDIIKFERLYDNMKTIRTIHFREIE